jgi:hypothetical protein
MKRWEGTNRRDRANSNEAARLADSAARARRSLNSELLHRLEQSLDLEAQLQADSRRRTKGRLMSDRRFRLVFALLALAVVVAGAAIAAVVLRPNATAGAQGAEVEGELPPALAAHLQKLSEAIPDNGGESSEAPEAPPVRTSSSERIPPLTSASPS